jgi:uncharacterized protein (DUF1810 family)
MWSVFPQIADLGQSQVWRTYAIASLEEAKTYLRHPVLGPRLIAFLGIVASAQARTAQQVLGRIDALRPHTSMTLLSRTERSERLFKATARPLLSWGRIRRLSSPS